MQLSASIVVRITMRLALLFLLIATPVAHAEEAVRPVLPIEGSVGLTLHGGKLAGIDEFGWGPNLELALGSGRWQAFGEASLAFVELGAEDSQVDGKQLRGGLGVRWLARSFELGRQGALDMHLEAFAGYSRSWFEGMNVIARPDLGAGVGYRIRAFIGRKQLALHVSARVFFAPTDRQDEAIACRGTCPMTDGNTNSGTMAVFAGAF